MSITRSLAIFLLVLLLWACASSGEGPLPEDDLRMIHQGANAPDDDRPRWDRPRDSFVLPDAPPEEEEEEAAGEASLPVIRVLAEPEPGGAGAEDPDTQVVRIVGEPGRKREGSKSRGVRHAVLEEVDLRDAGAPPEWPAFEEELDGDSTVRIVNQTGFALRAGLRSDGGGLDLLIDPGASAEASLPNGRYAMFFQYSVDAPGVYQGQDFTLSDRGMEIQVAPAIGNGPGVLSVK